MYRMTVGIRRRIERLPLLLFLFPIAVLLSAAQETSGMPVATFGTTVVIPAGLKGNIYHLPEGTNSLAALDRSKKPVGTIYTSSLNVRPQDFSIGFPGVTSRFEWFAIDYSGKFWIEKPGLYRFRLVADDGAMLYIDDQLIIDNDGVHSPDARRGSVRLDGGVHTIRVPYFQGPRFTVALLLEVAGPGDKSPRVFSTDEFKPPGNPEDWRYTGIPLPGAGDRDLERLVPDRIEAPALPGRRKGSRRF